MAEESQIGTRIRAHLDDAALALAGLESTARGANRALRRPARAAMREGKADQRSRRRSTTSPTRAYATMPKTKAAMRPYTLPLIPATTISQKVASSRKKPPSSGSYSSRLSSFGRNFSLNFGRLCFMGKL